jgi:hypothetical protein
MSIGYSTTYRWQTRIEPVPSVITCFRCTGRHIENPAAYSYLLGQYLGDGHIATVGRTYRLSVYCCTHYPAIVEEVRCAMAQCLTGVRIHQAFRRSACVGVQSLTRHWLCLFPQHGPGRKHQRLIELADWQKEIVAGDPRPLVRGLIHSDGCRGMNRVHNGTRTYAYPRYVFSNMSEDILGIFTDALDLLGIAWRQNRFNSISIARREAVAALDEFVGPKT